MSGRAATSAAAGLVLAGLWAACPARPAGTQAAENLVANGGFETDADGDGTADAWSFSGDPKGLEVKLTLEVGRKGGRCQRMTCTRYQRVSGWTHVMLCQLDRVKVRQGHRYRLALWARAEAIGDLAVGVGLQETTAWQSLGLRSSFVPTAKWERCDFEFVAPRTCTAHSRLQIWFNSTGSLWVDDVVLTEHPPPFGTGPRRPARAMKIVAGRNPIPNAGFECGPAGWGSESRYDYGWGTPMCRLFGQVVEDPTAPHGRRCLKIELNDETRPVAYFDYFDPVRHAVEAPLAGHVGFLELAPGRDHVVSAWLRADADDTPARLGVRYLDEWFHVGEVRVGRQWKRHHWAFRARRKHAYVVVGPDLRGAKRRSATVWIDAVRLEEGKAPGPFAGGDPVEVALATRPPGSVFAEGADPAIVVTAARPAGKGAAAPPTIAVEVEATDFRDRRVAGGRVKLSPAPGGSAEAAVTLGLKKRGFYRIRARPQAGRVVNDLRIAIIPRPVRKDSIIGINHAYGWDELTSACVGAGVLWARDWSLKWQHVEPEKGRFDFTQPDHQIGRALRLGHRVLGLLPFPSADWSSSAPPSVPAAKRYPASRRRMSYAPRDLEAFKQYVRRCVRHYRGRIRWWQCFNEPLYTDYSLPRKAGYKPGDYVRLARAFHEAAKSADPECKVLAGPGGWTVGSGRDLEGMLAAGLADACDAIDLHVYPGLKRPEAFARDLAQVRRMLDAAGARRPLWLTEHAYYADDDLVAVPPKAGFIKLLPSERVQAEYSIRLNLILLAGGVRKIFYHAGSSPALNRDHPESVFFDYGPRPRKVLPAVAAFAELFAPDVRFLKDLSPETGCRALLFATGERLVLAAWRPDDGGGPARLKVTGSAIELRDICGGPIAARTAALSSSPVYAVAEGVSQRDFEQAVELTPPRR